QKYDFEVFGLKKDKNFDTISTIHKKYSDAIFPMSHLGTCPDRDTYFFFRDINQRQILPCEIVLDIEDGNIDEILDKLKKWNCEFHAYTAGKGYHVHLFFPNELTQEKKLKVIKFFKCDEMKSSERTWIALENVKHWKSLKIKQEIQHGKRL
ncbi:unnamed protein product, partial [marine sediment metagenome]